MPDEFSETVVTAPAAAKEEGGRGAYVARGPIAEEMTEGDLHIREAGGGSGRIETDQVEGGMGGRALPQSVIDKIDAIEKSQREARAAAAAMVDETTEEQAPSEETQPTEEPVEAPPTEGEPAKAAAAPKTEHPAADVERFTRLEAANKALLAELEAERGKVREAPAPHKLLAEAGETYMDDQIGSIRRLVAAGMGIEDVSDKRVDDELRDLYADLTAHVIGVTPNEAHLAKRETARARHLVAREKRERTAEKQSAVDKARQDDDAKKAENASAFIGNRLQTKHGDGRSIAEDHPLLMQLAERVDGIKPEALIWKAIQHETRTGRLVLTADDDANIRNAAKLIESDYQALRDMFAKAAPTSSNNPSTAQPNGKPPTAAIAETRKDTRQGPGARTLTTADRSVAPATPPAKKPEQKKEPPKFKSKEEAKDYALRHLSD